MEKRCEWCGRKFEARSKKAQFCSGKCRTSHYRAKKTGIQAKEPAKSATPVNIRVSEDDIARQIAQLHGFAAFFSAAAERGPEKTSALCLLLAERIASALKEVGIS